MITISYAKKVLPLAVLILTSAAKSGLAVTGQEEVFSKKPSVYDTLPPASKGGTFYTVLSSNPKVINPLLSADANSQSLESFLWATLMSEDPDSLTPLPYLAESYKISADRKTYTFALSKLAKWQDGTPVTTDDVKFTFDTMMNPKVEATALRSYWEGTSLKIIDKQNFQFNVKEPRFDTLRVLYSFVTIQKKQFASEKDFNKSKGILNPIGNGPYKFASFSRDQSVNFERNKEWWASALPHFKSRFNADNVVARIIPDPTLEYEKFLKGEIDVTAFNQEIYALKIRGTDKDKVGDSPNSGKALWASKFENSAARGYQYIGWNLRNPLFNTPEIRRALSHIVDYKQIIEKVYFGLVVQATSPFGSLTQNSDQELRKPGKMITTDRKIGLKILKENGWSDSNGDNILDKMIDGKRVDFRFTLKYNSNNPLRGKIAQIVKENMKAAGIDVQVQQSEWNAYLEDIDKRQFEAVLLAWTGTPFPNAKQTWHSASIANEGSNFVGYSNPQVDKLIDQSNSEMNPEKRAEIMKEINRLIYNDQPYTFLTESKAMLAGFSKKVAASAWTFKYDVDPSWDIYTYLK